MRFDPATELQNFLVFGEFGDVNPSVCDSSTYTFLSVKTMEDAFDHEIEGCFLYSRHWNPTNKSLADALARMEGAESAQVTASGMSAISCALLHICSAGDEIVSGRTIYGGTYALLSNLLPRFGIKAKFVDLNDLELVKRSITENTKAIYCESLSNPLLDVANISELAKIAKAHGIQLVVDNTFAPMLVSPLRLGADVVVHSMTKFINGTSDCIAGAVISNHEFIAGMMDINGGTSMLLGPVLDSIRASSILKNLHSLHIRMVKHSHNAEFLAHQFADHGLNVHYPGLEIHPHHELMKSIINPGYGFGGILAVDLGTKEKADRLMLRMQEEKVGYLAVSLGYFKTLFSPPGHSTSSEIPEEERHKMGLGDGLIRFSVGLDQNIEGTWRTIEKLLKEVGY